MASTGFGRYWVSDLLEVWEVEKGYKSLRAGVEIGEGGVVSVFGARRVLKDAGRYTVQLGEGRHIELAPDYLQYTNHSCEPNVVFDTAGMRIVALRDIERGEEICFFYPSTEWDMDEGFVCQCGCEGCVGEVRGAAYLSEEVLGRYRLSAFVRGKLRR